MLHLHQVELVLAGDGELGEKANGQSFRERVLRYVAMAQTAMRSEQWETAPTAVSQAHQVLDLWHSQRTNWLAAIARRTTLQETFAALLAPDDKPAYADDVSRSLASAVDDAITAAMAPATADGQSSVDGPKRLAERLTKLGGYLERYTALLHTIEAPLPKPANLTILLNARSGRTKWRTTRPSWRRCNQ